MTGIAASLDDIVELLEAGATDFDAGAERAGFTLLDHGLQCAHLARAGSPDDLELQVAALVHDAGQTLTGNDEASHGEVGARFVAAVLGARVAALVRLHVPAKRYLVATDASYAGQLSPASIASLVPQGGPMTPNELQDFARLPHARAAALLRRYDDAAKVAGAVVDQLEAWLPVLRAVAARAGANATIPGVAVDRS